MSAVVNSPQNMEEPCVMSFTQEEAYLKIVHPSTIFVLGVISLYLINKKA